MGTNAISNLAILSVNWQEKQNYIDNFIPFIVDCMKNLPNDEISNGLVQRSLKKKFGLEIPLIAITILLRRVCKKGYLKQEHGIYKKNKELCLKIDLSKISKKLENNYNSILSKYISYCKNKYYFINADKANDTFINYMINHSAPILKEAFGLNRSRIKYSSEDQYMINSFIEEIKKTDENYFQFFIEIVKGCMLFTSLYSYQLQPKDQNFNNTDVFFDTRFLLRAIGYEGEPRKKPCLELIYMLKDLRTNLKCFNHTIHEIIGILSACKYNIHNPSQMHENSGVMQFFQEKRYTAIDIERFIMNIENDIRNLNINIVDSPPMTIDYSVNEERLYYILQDEINYQNPEALEKDVKSLTSVYRLRKGSIPRKIELSPSIFLTTNSSLARASTIFFKENYNYAINDESFIPLCFDINIFGTFIWLKKPLSVPEFPKQRVISDCYAAMNPSPELWNKYLEEIDRQKNNKIITDDQYLTLLSTLEIKNILMDITYGNPQAFSEATIKEIQKRYIQTIKKESEKKYMGVEKLKIKFIEIGGKFISSTFIFLFLIIYLISALYTMYNIIIIKNIFNNFIFLIISLITTIIIIIITTYYGKNLKQIQEYLFTLSKGIVERLWKKIFKF